MVSCVHKTEVKMCALLCEDCWEEGEDVEFTEFDGLEFALCYECAMERERGQWRKDS